MSHIMHICRRTIETKEFTERLDEPLVKHPHSRGCTPLKGLLTGTRTAYPMPTSGDEGPRYREGWIFPGTVDDAWNQLNSYLGRKPFKGLITWRHLVTPEHKVWKESPVGRWMEIEGFLTDRNFPIDISGVLRQLWNKGTAIASATTSWNEGKTATAKLVTFVNLQVNIILRTTLRIGVHILERKRHTRWLAMDVLAKGGWYQSSNLKDTQDRKCWRSDIERWKGGRGGRTIKADNHRYWQVQLGNNKKRPREARSRGTHRQDKKPYGGTNRN
jgi:hypothetical protein